MVQFHPKKRETYTGFSAVASKPWLPKLSGERVKGSGQKGRYIHAWLREWGQTLDLLFELRVWSFGLRAMSGASSGSGTVALHRGFLFSSGP